MSGDRPSFTSLISYSCLSASMGLNFAAFLAGYIPQNTPTAVENSDAPNTVTTSFIFPSAIYDLFKIDVTGAREVLLQGTIEIEKSVSYG